MGDLIYKYLMGGRWIGVATHVPYLEAQVVHSSGYTERPYSVYIQDWNGKIKSDKLAV